MAKQTGLGDKLLIGGYDVSGDIGALGKIGGGPAAMDMTGIDKSAFERFGGQLDGGIEFTGFFNKDAGRLHSRLSTLPTVDVTVTYLRGQGIGNAAASIVAKQLNYDLTRGNDGALAVAVTTQGSAGYPLEWGEQLTAGIRTDTAATNGSSFDAGAASAHGLQAYLHVIAFTGTSVTVKLQQSSDNGAGDAWADVTGGGFTAATAAGAQRIETVTGQAVERYLRVVTTGTFSNAQFAVQVTRNQTARSY